METYARPPVTRVRGKEPSLELSSAELAEVLKDASSIQTSRQETGRELATLDEAIVTARELGIAEEHVREAASRLQRKKDRLLRLRNVTRHRRNNILRMMGSMLMVGTIVSLAAGFGTAKIVLMAMSIGLAVMVFRWLRAIGAERYPELFDTRLKGECSVCGNPSVKRDGTFCSEHLPAEPQ